MHVGWWVVTWPWTGSPSRRPWQGWARRTSLVRGDEPDFTATQAISVAWSEATLGYLHQLSCEDPLTGLASLAHVRSRLAELYRGQLREDAAVRETHALVVVDAAQPRDAGGHRDGHGAEHRGGRADVLTLALRLSRLAETTRTVFPGTETLGRLGRARIVVVAGRDPRLGQRTALLRRMLAGTGPDTGSRTGSRAGQAPVRVWIEGLPDSDRAAASLLDELARL